MTLNERGREGGVTSGVIRRDRIMELVGHLPVDQRLIEAYKKGYDAGYHTALKRTKK